MEKKKNNKITLAIILIAIIILAILWLIIGGNKKGAQKAEPDVPTQPVALNILVEEQNDEPYPYDDVSVLYGIWKATDADYKKKKARKDMLILKKTASITNCQSFICFLKKITQSLFITDMKSSQRRCTMKQK